MDPMSSQTSQFGEARPGPVPYAPGLEVAKSAESVMSARQALAVELDQLEKEIDALAEHLAPARVAPAPPPSLAPEPEGPTFGFSTLRDDYNANRARVRELVGRVRRLDAEIDW